MQTIGRTAIIYVVDHDESFDGASGASLNSIFTLGDTPGWAAARFRLNVSKEYYANSLP